MPDRPKTDGISAQRLKASFVRTCDRYRGLRRMADDANDQLDDVTSPIGVPIKELAPDDSLVVATENALAQTKR